MKKHIFIKKDGVFLLAAGHLPGGHLPPPPPPLPQDRGGFLLRLFLEKREQQQGEQEDPAEGPRWRRVPGRRKDLRGGGGILEELEEDAREATGTTQQLPNVAKSHK